MENDQSSAQPNAQPNTAQPNAGGPEITSGGLNAADQTIVAKDMADWLSTDKISKADYDAYYLEAGIAPPVAISDAAKQLNEEAPPAKSGSEYVFSPSVAITPEMTAFQDGARQLLMDINAPANIGTSLGKLADSIAAKNEGLDEGARYAAKEKNTSLLQQTWGKEYPANLKVVQAGWSEAKAKYPDVVNALEAAGCADDPVFINTLLGLLKNQGRRKGYTT